MALRVRGFLGFGAALAAAAASAVGAGARPNVLPTLYVQYTNNCTFTITNDSGQAVTSILPGTYQVYITTPQVFAFAFNAASTNGYACAPNGFTEFQLTGPGVNIMDTLQQGDEDKDVVSATFAPASTYVAQENLQPSITRTTFTTQATGSAGQVASGITNNNSGGGETQSTLVGSLKANHLLGSLDAIVYKTGKLALLHNGNTVKSLKSGQWTFSVDDESTKAGFDIQALHGGIQTITSGSYTGTHDVTVTLKPGRWVFFSPGGKQTIFYVVS